MIFRDGRIYEGDWLAGRMHGMGFMTYDDGRVHDGMWKDGKFLMDTCGMNLGFLQSSGCALIE
jgi:hypothetical protein